MMFYQHDTDKYYSISTLAEPIKVKILPRNLEEPIIYWQCEHDADEDGQIIATFEKEEDFWERQIEL